MVCDWRLLVVAWVGIDVCVGDCANYYNGVEFKSGQELRKQLHELIRGHTVIPYTSSAVDVWDALRDLDADPAVSGNVLLIYSGASVSGDENVGGWNREHLWPKSYGVGDNGADFSDLHHLKPCDANVNSARNNLIFDNCLTEPCKSPAHEEAGEGSAKDATRFMPPPQDRGDVARAIMYMAVRYDGEEPSDTNVIDLQLSNCPSQSGFLGMLDTLLQWHQDDPPSQAERDRNSKICEKYQGNRNPFIDFPDLATEAFGKSAYVDVGCGQTTLSPTVSTEEPEEPEMQVGDVVVVGVNSGGSEKEFALLVTKELKAGMQLVVTDNAWLGTRFRTTEGYVTFTVPQTGIAAGTVLVWTESNTAWETTGSFTISASGDSLIVFQSASPATVFEGKTLPEFSFAFTMNRDEWTTPSEDMDSSESALPLGLASHQVALTHRDNYVFSGDKVVSRMDLFKQISDKTRWQGSDQERFDLNALSFKIESQGDDGGGDGDGEEESNCNHTQVGILFVICSYVLNLLYR